MNPLINVLQEAVNALEKQQIPAPRRQAEELLSFSLNIHRVDLYLEHDRPLTQDEIDRFNLLLQRRLKREPLAYILGFQPFLDLSIEVNPSVLIPRSETEFMTHEIIESLQKQELEGHELWDLCTGSGCIGIALKKRFPKLNVTVSDISKEALKTASRNGAKNNVSIDIVQGDLLRPFRGKKAHYIVCNPPYIDASESLEPEVGEYEPFLALYAEEKGLDFYNRLSQQLPEVLLPGGGCWLEMGSTQGEVVRDIFLKNLVSPSSNGSWAQITLHKDLSGHNRFLYLRRAPDRAAQE